MSTVQTGYLMPGQQKSHKNRTFSERRDDPNNNVDTSACVTGGSSSLLLLNASNPIFGAGPKVHESLLKLGAGSDPHIFRMQTQNDLSSNVISLSNPNLLAIKKQGISGESSDSKQNISKDIAIKKFPKDFRSKQLIKDAILDNDFMKNLASSQVKELVESMFMRDFRQGEYVIREGEAGAHLFVSDEGEFEVVKDGKILGKMGPGKVFGELAILYNCTRTASIRGKLQTRRGDEVAFLLLHN